jgi:hypothetical protein
MIRDKGYIKGSVDRVDQMKTRNRAGISRSLSGGPLREWFEVSAGESI